MNFSLQMHSGDCLSSPVWNFLPQVEQKLKIFRGSSVMDKLMG